MNPIYQLALQGRLASPESAELAMNTALQPVTIWNNQPVAIHLSYLTSSATKADMGTLPAGYAAVIEAAPGDQILVTSATLGSFMGTITIAATTTSVYFGPNKLVPANQIGQPPSPTKQSPIPPDPPRIFVAAGFLDNYNVVVREQQWMRSPRSFSILPNQQQDISSTTTTALQHTSSTTDTVAASVSASASAGWGPYSASVSASLNKNSTTFQSFTMNNTTTAYRADHIAGSGGSTAEYYLEWTLVDTITVLKASKETIQSATVSNQAPSLMTGPWRLEDLIAEALPEGPSLTRVGYPRRRISFRQVKRLRATGTNDNRAD